MAAFSTFQPSDFFNTVLYTGTGAEQTITGVGFQPDFTWCKDRTNSYDQVWYDAARGATKRITSNTDTAESDQAQGLKSWNSDGFVVGTGSNINNNTNLFVGYNWKAGTTSGLTGGTITPTAYSINTTSGFGAYKYTGTATAATIPHGLGVAPAMIIVKNLSAVDNWQVYHQSVGNTKYLKLNGTNAATTSAASWNDTSPTSTLFSIGDSTSTNGSGNSLIAYCFADKSGYSQFGKYLGNSQADGTFQYTGFRPAFVMLKKTDATSDWYLFDNKRQGYNTQNEGLRPNSSAGELTDDYMDLVSNGFKLISTNTELNNGGSPYIYMAFAEFPFVSSNDVPGVAR